MVTIHYIRHAYAVDLQQKYTIHKMIVWRWTSVPTILWSLLENNFWEVLLKDVPICIGNEWKGFEDLTFYGKI